MSSSTHTHSDDDKDKFTNHEPIIIHVNDKADYDRYVNLEHQREQYKTKLLSQYGFDVNTGGFNSPKSLEIDNDDKNDVVETKLSQVEAIGEDIEEWQKRRDALFECLVYLAKKYSEDGVFHENRHYEIVPPSR